MNRLRTLTTDGPSGTVQSYIFTPRPGGHREKIEEHDGTIREYAYDDLYRLTNENVTSTAGLVYDKVFDYDSVGNRNVQATTGLGARVVNYTYDERDRLLTENGTVYGWDDNGNLTSKSGEATYFWDFENRLVRVEKADGTVVTHAYDADGNRFRTEVTPATGPPTVTDFLVDPSGFLSHVVAETDDTGNVIGHYVRGVDDLLSVIRPTETRYYHADGLGSIRFLTDESGNITDTYQYTAFGELLAHAGSEPQPYTFAGEPYDPNIGFYYNRARWLAPTIGRFASVDPWAGFIYDPVTLHKYVYAWADPVNTVDPDGLEPLPATIAALQIRVSLAVSTLGVRLVAAFAAGGPVIGRLFNAIGRFAQTAAHEVLVFYQSIRPGFEILAQRQTGARVIDFFVRFGNRAAWIEVKYALPWRAGEPLTRLVGQVQAAAAAAEGQVVLWTLRPPSVGQVKLVLDHLGQSAARVQFVHGIEGLYRWLLFYFGGV